MALAPWEKYAAPSPAAPAGVLGSIPGRVDPYKARDQELQEQAAARAEEDQRFQREKFEREQAKTATDPKLVEGERTAAFLTTRIANGMRDIDAATASNPDAAKPGFLASVAGVFGSEARNFANSPDRRQVEAAQMDVLDAALTLGTGAAYTKEQLEGYRQAYFPKLTDDAATIAGKRQRLNVLLEAAKLKAGSAAPKINEALAGAEGEPAPKMPYEAFRAQIQSIISDQTKPPEQRFQAAMTLAQQAGQQVDPEQLKTAIGAGRANIYEGEQPQSIPAQLGEATANAVAAVGEGIGMLPDMAANAVGATLALPADAMGFDNVARDLRNPTTFGGLIEQAVPTPQDAVGRGVRLVGQFGGGMIGFPQRAAQAVTNRILGGGPPPPPVNAMSGNPIMGAAQRQGVDLLPADVGGQGIKSFTSAAAQAPFSRGSVVDVSRRAAGQMDRAITRTAGNEGNVLPADEAGEVVRRGGEKFVKQTRERASRYYDRAHEMADGVKIMPDSAIRVIDEQIALKSQAGEMSGDIVGELEKVRRSLDQTGGVTAVGLREARSILGSMARNDKLKGTDAKRIFGMVLDAASDDMATSLTAAGKQGASRMFRRADTLWKERIAEIDEVLEPVIGKGKSGEDIVSAVESMARGQRGGVSRLGRMLATLPAEEKGDITATVIDRMGRATASAQDDTGSIFSSETFLTNWNKMSGKGKAALFGSGETRRNLDDIAMIAAGRRDTASLASKSNTPIGITANATPYAALGVASPPAALAGITLQYATGKLLASPKFTRWLARAPKAEGAIKGHVARLTTIASENPAISDDILGLQQRLVESLGQPGRLAAEQDVSDVRP